MLAFYLAALDTDAERITMTDLYNNHKNRLTNIALKITKNQYMAEDAVHNTFLAIIEHKEKIFSMDAVNFLRWSVIVVRGKCIDLLRREKHYEKLPSEYGEGEWPYNEESIDDWILKKDMYERMIGYIDELDDVSRQVLEMKYVLQMTLSEIGNELGLTVAQVNGRIVRAKVKVRKQMESELKTNG